MATIQRKGENWYCQFLYKKVRHTFTVGKVTERQARAKADKVEELLGLIKRRILDAPPDAKVVEFMLHDDRRAEEVHPANIQLTLLKLREEYLELHASLLDPRTIADMRGHWKHLARLLDEGSQEVGGS